MTASERGMGCCRASTGEDAHDAGLGAQVLPQQARVLLLVVLPCLIQLLAPHQAVQDVNVCATHNSNTPESGSEQQELQD